MNSAIALIINIPTLFLLYIMIYFTQALSGKRQFYGVSLNSDYFNKQEFKKLDKQFKVLVTIGFILFTFIALVCVYIFKAFAVASILPMLGFCIYQFLAFVYIHNQVKSLKKDLSLEIENIDLEKTRLVLDTSFLRDKNTIIKNFSILYMIPFIVTILIGAYTVLQYNNIPETIPTHWNINGVADAFSKKTPTTVGSIFAMSVCTGFLIFVSSIACLKSRGKLDNSDIEHSKKSHLDYLKKFALVFLVLNTGCQVIFSSILVSTLNGSNINVLLLWTCTVLIIVASLYQTYLYYKSPNKSKSAVYTVDDDDSNWILGTFYYNPSDPSIFVQKRFGVGWTVNVGSTKGKLFIILTFLIIVFSLLIAFIG